MVDQTSNMFITGPDVIKTVTGEDVGFEELGGAHAHNTKSGVAHFKAADEAECLELARDLLSYLPSNNLDDPPTFDVAASLDITDDDRELDTLIPDSANQPYDMHRVIEHVLDDGEFLEVHALFAPNIVCGFGRVEGRSVGVVANQPMQFAGTLDIDASEKAARFVRTCDAFNVPVLTFVDVPGFLPGTDQEWGGIIRRGAKLIYAYAEATVPKVTVITRKAYGGAYDVMGSKHLRADVNLAWPTAQVAVMGAQGAVNILYRRELAASPITGDAADRARAGLRGPPRQSVHRCRARVRRRGHPAVGDAGAGRHVRCARCEPSGRRCRRRSTGTSRCERHLRPVVTEQEPDRACRARHPTPEELAALIAVTHGARSRPPRTSLRRNVRSDWAAYRRNVRRRAQHGPGAGGPALSRAEVATAGRIAEWEAEPVASLTKLAAARREIAEAESSRACAARHDRGRLRRRGLAGR